jgi:hypothetical protein
MSFDFGVEVAAAAGSKTFVNPTVGSHTARVAGIFHLGVYTPEWQGEIKPAAPYVSIVLELLDASDITEGTGIFVSKDMALKKGSKANATKFLAAFPKCNNFDDIVGSACTVNIVQSGKGTNEDGTPKYVGVGGFSELPAQFESMVPALSTNYGVVFDRDYTKENIRALNPYLELVSIGMEAANYDGSNMQKIIKEIQAENEKFCNFGGPVDAPKVAPAQGEVEQEAPSESSSGASFCEEEY